MYNYFLGASTHEVLNIFERVAYVTRAILYLFGDLNCCTWMDELVDTNKHY